ncbi:diphthamide biosynthesis enzyme Dph2 [Stygiolobus caldivivus]|uniref:2-(3-amino-3-carboxypropyl)histidine synthase n=1 Tax=Stygiolobus caldivivus TaxID=2824673 RepID=A0A8D5U4T3_9CREN|nr:diphthamide biosynthesis enzyme Dph2 [Stygiolobus caldivivus]BCU69475.1 diphthamide biosynthesis enzyme Dph2 [Stygiolobus caldivivus]
MNYDFEIGKTLEEIKNRHAKRVLLQFPEGLKPFSIKVVSELREKLPDVEFIVSTEPSWGACDVAEDEATTLKVDLIIHYGHTPYTWYYPKFPTVFIEVRSNLTISDEQVRDLVSILRDKYGARKLSLTATIQHVQLIKVLKSKLNEFQVLVGKPSSPFMYDGQVLGCDYKSAQNVEADVYLNISGGLFHALGVGLATGKPIIKVDPYTGKNEDLTDEVYKILKVRYGKIMKALDARTWVIIQGVKTGQNRPLMVKYFEKKLTERGYKVYVISNRSLSKDTLRNIDNSEVDVFMVTSCPRLPIDDLYDYEKPVLTPGEAKMIISGNLDKYIFPW